MGTNGIKNTCFLTKMIMWKSPVYRYFGILLWEMSRSKSVRDGKILNFTSKK
jgi:hypothetical protein